MDSDIKKLFEEQRKIFSEDMKGYFGALIEDFDAKSKLISEQPDLNYQWFAPRV